MLGKERGKQEAGCGSRGHERGMGGCAGGDGSKGISHGGDGLSKGLNMAYLEDGEE